MSNVARVEQKQELSVSENTAMVSMFERMASDPNVDVDKLERLMQMRERAVEREAESAFNIALSDAQARMGTIGADANNPQTRSKYASYGKLDSVLRPIYTSSGFALSFDTGSDAPADCVRVLCHVTHKAGHSRTYHVDMPADGKGAKGGDVMTKTHAVGAGMSYGMRYLLKMIFNVAVGEYDTDGNDPEDMAGGATEQMVTDWLSTIEATITLDDLKKLSGQIADQKMPQHSRDSIRKAYNARKSALSSAAK